jgi:hypothetical protein
MLRPDTGAATLSKADLLAQLARIEALERAKAARKAQQARRRIEALIARRRAGEGFATIAPSLGMSEEQASNLFCWHTGKMEPHPFDGMPFAVRKAVEHLGLGSADEIAAAVESGELSEDSAGLGSATLNKLRRWMEHRSYDWQTLQAKGAAIIAGRRAKEPPRRMVRRRWKDRRLLYYPQSQRRRQKKPLPLEA